MKREAIIRRKIAREQRATTPRHRLYWASHGCDKANGHKGKCSCWCGDRPRRNEPTYT